MVKIEDVKLIKVRVGVRYWEDSEYNGVEDVSLFDATEPITPNMPFAVHSGRDNWKDYEWIIKINPLNGKIVGWKEGDTANIHYKSCDDITVYLLGDNDVVLAEYNCYVPSFLSPYGDGDYVIFEIESDGTIKGFSFTEDDIEELKRNALP